MARICVAGAYAPTNNRAREFAELIGKEIAAHNHILLSGCRNECDATVAKGAVEWLKANGLATDDRIISYIVQGGTPSHKYGTVLQSGLPDWDLTYKRLHPPEPISSADVVILFGGSDGTMRAANWARISKRILLPITAFKGAAEEIYKEEIKEFDVKYADHIDRFHYELLSSVPADLARLAKDVVTIAERILSSGRVFVIMAFSNTPELIDAYETFQEVCKEYQYEARRVDDANCIDRILPKIQQSIERSAFVIADLTEEKPNVYYELGFAQGLNKVVIVTARKGTPLPFDVKDIPTIFWESQKQLKQGLKEKIGMIATTPRQVSANLE